MTPISSIIEETIRLQRETNVLQAISLVGIFIADIFILLCIVSIRKTMRINREWSEANARWSASLRAASGMPLRENNEDCSRPQAGSPTEGDAQTGGGNG